jgi:hypothetical protein
MLRNKSGEPFTVKQYYYYKKLLAKEFENEDNVAALDFKQNDIDVINAFLFLLHQERNSDINFIRIAFEKTQHRIYRERKKDIDLEGKEHIEKLIISIAKKRYKKLAIGKVEKDSYTYKRILAYIHYHMNQRKGENPNRKYLVNFIKKYAQKTKSAMDNIRVTFNQYKNSASARLFIDKHSKGFYEGKIDNDNLFKFLSVTKKIGSNKEDLEWLSELIDIILQRPPYVRKTKEDYELDAPDEIEEIHKVSKKIPEQLL